MSIWMSSPACARRPARSTVSTKQPLMTSQRTTRASIVVAIACVLAAPAVSRGATASIKADGHVAVVAGPGAADVVAILGADGAIVLENTGAPMRAGRGCRRTRTGTVHCPLRRGAPIDLQLGDGDDFADLTRSPVAVHAHGGAGDDALSASAHGDLLDGGPGADTLTGGLRADLVGGAAGDDYLSGHEDVDLLRGGDGADEIQGGTGADDLGGDSGDDRLTGAADDDVVDGGDGDDVATGDGGEDRLVGAAGTDLLSGGAGRDQLAGGSGADALSGDAGDDVLDGGDDGDHLQGDAGADLLLGGGGDDQLDPGPGGDSVDAGDGNDAIKTDDGERDDVACGTGVDNPYASDLADLLRAGCEPAGPAPFIRLPLMTFSPFKVHVKAKLYRSRHARRVKVRVERLRRRDTVELHWFNSRNHRFGHGQRIRSVPTGRWMTLHSAHIPRRAKRITAVDIPQRP
ncbi:MAG: Hemolysin-type calcium-binding region [Conexibacter sp.]|nr:Hemolysin-type calcium-binding region [Conexibacter sp.]